MYGSGGFNVWSWIILILIVLQRFRVGHTPAGFVPEGNLLNNGGLFIMLYSFSHHVPARLWIALLREGFSSYTDENIKRGF